MTVANWGWRGGSGLCSTTQDLLRFVRALKSGTLVSAATLERMWAPHAFCRKDPDSDVYSGYGWVVAMKEGKRPLVRHSGDESGPGHNGLLWMYEGGDGFIVLSNAGSYEGRGWAGVVGSGIVSRLSR